VLKIKLNYFYTIMKTKILILVLSGWLLSPAFGQNTQHPDSLGLPGDNLNLYAVLDLFSKSKTFEEFEQQLNDESNRVNNLDLNNDGKIDYLRVIDNKNGDNHAVVIQDPINSKENQDVAVIELEKTSNGQYNVQIVGNEDLYGKDYIIEPSADPATQTNNPAYNNTNNVAPQTNVNVYIAPAYWPIVTYMYGPAYAVYVSPWYWGYYPSYWRPWRPWYYPRYYGYYYHRYPVYHQYYHRTMVYRSPVVNSYYGPRRTTSTVVIQNRSQGVYHNTYRVTNRGGAVYRSSGGTRYQTGGNSSTQRMNNSGSNNNYAPRVRNTAPSNNTPNMNNRSGGGNVNRMNGGGGGSYRMGGGNGGGGGGRSMGGMGGGGGRNMGGGGGGGGGGGRMRR